MSPSLPACLGIHRCLRVVLAAHGWTAQIAKLRAVASWTELEPRCVVSVDEGARWFRLAASRPAILAAWAHLPGSCDANSSEGTGDATHTHQNIGHIIQIDRHLLATPCCVHLKTCGEWESRHLGVCCLKKVTSKNEDFSVIFTNITSVARYDVMPSSLGLKAPATLAWSTYSVSSSTDCSAGSACTGRRRQPRRSSAGSKTCSKPIAKTDATCSSNATPARLARRARGRSGPALCHTGHWDVRTLHV